jgi:LPXTG-motif cell wall-anchored protein
MSSQLHWSGAAAIALLLVLLVGQPSTVSAGGVSILLDEPPRNIQANVAFTVGFTIRSAHEGRTLQPDLQPLLVATKVGSKEQVTAEAREEGGVAHYVATLTLPAAGAWQWEIAPFSPGDMYYRLSLPGPLEVGSDNAAAPPVDEELIQDAKALDNVFEPIEMTVPAGTTVIWHNAGKLPHTVTAADDGFSSGNMEPGAEWSYTFEEPGTYAYYCQYHAARPAAGGDVQSVELLGGGGHMVGTIVVTAAANAAQPAEVKTEAAPTTAVLAQVAVQPEAAGATGAADAPALPRTGGPGVLYILFGLVALLAASTGLLLRRRSGA